jgi:hypothetical protein
MSSEEHGFHPRGELTISSSGRRNRRRSRPQKRCLRMILRATRIPQGDRKQVPGEIPQGPPDGI